MGAEQLRRVAVDHDVASAESLAFLRPDGPVHVARVEVLDVFPQFGQLVNPTDRRVVDEDRSGPFRTLFPAEVEISTGHI